MDLIHQRKIVRLLWFLSGRRALSSMFRCFLLYRISHYGIMWLIKWRESFRLRGLRGHCYVAGDTIFSQCIVVVNSRCFFEAVRKRLVDRAVPETISMGGGHKKNILYSGGSDWQAQRAVIHPGISRAKGRFSDCLRKQLQTLRLGDGDIDLFNTVAAVNRRAIAEGLNIPVFEYSARKMNVFFFATGVVLSVLALPQWLAEIVTCYLHRLVFGLEARRIARIICCGKHTFCNHLVKAFGLSETLGHLWAIVNGSSIPEASMVCDIISCLANDVSEQEKVLDMLVQNRNDQFKCWIRIQCRAHVYFQNQTKRLCESTIIDGVLLHAGTLIRTNLRWLNEAFPEDVYTTGFGTRRCPGAQIGIESIDHWVAYIVRNYHVRTPTGRFFSTACNLQDAYPYHPFSMGFKHLGTQPFHFLRRK